MKRDLGDCKPSQLFRRMQDLTSEQVSNEFHLTLWLKKLPKDIETHVRGLAKVTEIPHLLLIAGMAKGLRRNINGVEDKPSIHPSVMMDKINNSLIDAVTKNSQSLNNSSNFNKNEQKRKLNNDNICFYHSTFGENALKWRMPCKYQEKNSSHF